MTITIITPSALSLSLCSAPVDPLSSPPDVAVRCLHWIDASIGAAHDESVDPLSGTFIDDDVDAASTTAGASEDASSSSSRQSNGLLRDDADKFLQKLPSLAKNQGNLATKKEAKEENVEDSKKIEDQIGLNVLTVGFGRNMVSRWTEMMEMMLIVDCGV